MLASALRRAGSGVLRNNAAMMAPRAAGGVAMGADRRRYNHPGQPETMWATTILSVRKGNKVVVIGDGQVTQGHFVVKDNARKVRRLQNGNVITGFAGAAVDALTLFDRLEGKLEQYPQLMRACVELAKEWRSDKSLRRALNAVLIVADKDITLSISGTGDILEPMNGVIGIGSGGIYAQTAATALIDVDGLTAEEIAKKSMKIASDTCIYTNHNYVTEIIDIAEKEAEAAAALAKRPEGKKG